MSLYPTTKWKSWRKKQTCCGHGAYFDSSWSCPSQFMAFCFQTSTFFINRLPTPVLSNKYPYEVLYNKHQGMSFCVFLGVPTSLFFIPIIMISLTFILLNVFSSITVQVTKVIYAFIRVLVGSMSHTMRCSLSIHFLFSHSPCQIQHLPLTLTFLFLFPYPPQSVMFLLFQQLLLLPHQQLILLLHIILLHQFLHQISLQYPLLFLPLLPLKPRPQHLLLLFLNKTTFHLMEMLLMFKTMLLLLPMLFQVCISTKNRHPQMSISWKPNLKVRFISPKCCCPYVSLLHSYPSLNLLQCRKHFKVLNGNKIWNWNLILCVEITLC